MHRQTALGALASFDRSTATMSKTNIMNPSSNIYVNTELDLALGRSGPRTSRRRLQGSCVESVDRSETLGEMVRTQAVDNNNV